MTVTVDLAVESIRTDTTNPWTWSHASPAAQIEGVLVGIVQDANSDDRIVSVDYGGHPLTRIQRNVDTLTEPGSADWWFSGASGLPTGTQTVTVTLDSATTDNFHFVSITLNGADKLEVVDRDGINNNVADPSVTLQYGGRTCMAFAALYGGGAAPSSFTENANCIRVHDVDAGATYSVVLRQTTAGSSNFAIGGTAATDDVAFAALAISEVAGSDGSATGTGAATGVGTALKLADGSAAGTSAVTGAGATLAAADASSAGTSTVTGAGATLAAADASSAGTGVATGVGQSTAASDASSAGTGTATGVGQSTAASDASSAGTGAATGVGQSTAASDATSAGTGAGTGVGQSTAAADASSAGTATVTGEGQGLSNSGDGVAAGTSTVTGAGAAIVAADGTSAGASTVSGVGASVIAADGSSAGASTVSGAGAQFLATTGTITAIAQALGIGASTWAANGASAGTAAVNGEPFLIASRVREKKIVLLRQPESFSIIKAP